VIVVAPGEHEVSGGKDRRGHGNDGFARSSTSLEAQKLGAEVALLGTGRARGRLHQRGLEPWGALAQSGRAAGEEHLDLERDVGGGGKQRDLGDEPSFDRLTQDPTSPLSFGS
jgi:hypothetical protein